MQALELKIPPPVIALLVAVSMWFARSCAPSLGVATGIYRFTRNPMYLGMLIVLVGWAVILANAISFALVPMFVLFMNRFQIGPEERVLSAHFSSEYVTYMRSVRRWL